MIVQIDLHVGSESDQKMSGLGNARVPFKLEARDPVDFRAASIRGTAVDVRRVVGRKHGKVARYWVEVGQMCEGCSEALPRAQLDTLYRNDPALYCGACRSEREDKADKVRDEDYYGE